MTRFQRAERSHVNHKGGRSSRVVLVNYGRDAALLREGTHLTSHRESDVAMRAIALASRTVAQLAINQHYPLATNTSVALQENGDHALSSNAIHD